MGLTIKDLDIAVSKIKDKPDCVVVNPNFRADNLKMGWGEQFVNDLAVFVRNNVGGDTYDKIWDKQGNPKTTNSAI